MNRNRKCSKKVAAGIAVGMAAVMSAVPVLAAEEAASVSKEETVYVNADASGNKESVTVSSWLKNAGSEKELKDSSDLQDIVNVKAMRHSRRMERDLPGTRMMRISIIREQLTKSCRSM